MKRIVRVDFEVDAATRERLLPLFALEVPDHGFRVGRQSITFSRREGALGVVLDALRAEGIPHEEHVRRFFTDGEIEEAPAVRLHEGMAPAPSTSRRTEYSLERACPLCLMGREQVSDLVLDEAPERRTGIAVTPAGQLLVGERIAREMIMAGMTGCVLRGVRDGADRVTDVFQVLPVHTLPPLSIPPARLARDEEQSCPGCRRGGLRVESMLYYALGEDGFTDVNVSRETVGSGPASHPELVVSQRLFRILLEHTDRTPDVEPVVLV